MGEGEKPEGLTPEEIADKLTQSPDVEVDETTRRAREAGALSDFEDTLDEIAKKAVHELPNEPRAPISPLAEEFDRLNHLAAEKLGTGEPDEIQADDLDRSVDAKAASDIDAMMPTEGRSGMHQPVETPTRAEPQPSHEANLERERRDSMYQEMSEGAQRYRDAFLTAVDQLRLHERSETVKERWEQLNAQNKQELLAFEATVRSGPFTDPMVIRAKFDVAAERLTRFAEHADAGRDA